MAKLNLVIADSDIDYARGISDYINSNHSKAFQVSCFTQADSLAGYLKQQPSPDILMASPDFYEISSSHTGIKLKVLLTAGVLSGEYPGFQAVNKYCTGDKLLSDIMHLYSENNPSELRISPNSGNAEIIGVYSPAGGTGKTTIAYALSVQCAERGMSSFYLNLESFQSTGIFFDSNGSRNLSYIFYYIKEKCKNLSFKMEGIKCTDAGYGVQYFNPPESPLEYEEIEAFELEQLIQGIKGMGCCDCVFIDMSSTFDMKNYKIMELCDKIVLITLQEPVSMHKCKLLYNEIIKLTRENKGSVSDKFINVINRYKSDGWVGAGSISDEPYAAAKIPEYSRAFINENGKLVIDDDGFIKAVNQLINEISGK